MGLLGYLSQYRLRQMAELLQNEKMSPRECDVSLEGKTVVLTGATSGIGRVTARYFAERGAGLICVNRSRDKSDRLEEELSPFKVPVRSIIADFSSLEQTRECALTLAAMDEPIDVVIHNAGVFNTRKRITGDGIEMVFQVNHLSSFMMNYLLKEKLKRENRARIIYVNSEGHRFALAGVHLNDLHWKRHLYTGLKSYGAAKTAQLLTMMRFAELFSPGDVTINAMHPGNVKSEMGHNNGRFYNFMKRHFILPGAKDPLQSARALHYLAASEEGGEASGRFYNLTAREEPAPHARDARTVDAVWNRSLELCGLN